MYLDKDICKEGNPVLKIKCQDVKLPLDGSDLSCLKQLYQYLIVSENEELAKQYHIRPGVGMAAPQVGVAKRMFAMNCVDFLDEKQTKYSYCLINPKIIATTKDMVYLPGGEGCLSVTRVTDGFVVPRYYGIKFKAYMYDFNTNKVKPITKNLYGYPAIVFQHEYDHLDGILYVDKMIKEQECDVLPLFTINEEDENDSN